MDIKKHVVFNKNEDQKLIRTFSLMITHKMKCDIDKLKFKNISVTDSVRNFIQGLIDENLNDQREIR